MTTPPKSELDAARERLELSYRWPSTPICTEVCRADLRLVLDALAQAERVADAGNRHINYSKYLPWSKSGGPNECEHGCAAGIPCRMCDATTLRNWRSAAQEPSHD